MRREKCEKLAKVSHHQKPLHGVCMYESMGMGTCGGQGLTFGSFLQLSTLFLRQGYSLH